MLPLRRVAGEAQAAIGDKARHRRLAMAGIARHVRVYRIRMGCPDVNAAVAARAVAPGAVVIFMAGSTGLYGWGRLQRDRGLVARRTADLRMRRVRKRDGPRPSRMIVNRNGDALGVR